MYWKRFPKAEFWQEIWKRTGGLLARLQVQGRRDKVKLESREPGGRCEREREKQQKVHWKETDRYRMKKGSKRSEQAVSKRSPCWETSAKNICRHVSVTARKGDPCHRNIKTGLTTCGIWLRRTQRSGHQALIILWQPQFRPPSGKQMSEHLGLIETEGNSLIQLFPHNKPALFHPHLSEKKRGEKKKTFLPKGDRKRFWSIYHKLFCFAFVPEVRKILPTLPCQAGTECNLRYDRGAGSRDGPVSSARTDDCSSRLADWTSH